MRRTTVGEKRDFHTVIGNHCQPDHHGESTNGERRPTHRKHRVAHRRIQQQTDADVAVAIHSFLLVLTEQPFDEYVWVEPL